MDFRLPTFLLTADSDLPLHEELWNYFVNTYIYNDVTYENLDFGGLFSVQTLIIGLFVGLAAASFGAVFNKKVIGGFVNKVLSEGCVSPDTAKSLPELDMADKLTLRYSVRHGVNLRRVMRCREEDEHIAAEEQKALAYAEMRKENPKLPKKFTPRAFKVDPDKHHFYIPEDMKYTAQTKFDQKGISWGRAILYAALILAVLVVFIIFLPNMLSVLDDFIGMLKG